MPNIGLPEIAIVLLIVLVIFGPKRLPQLGRSLGSGMREFKDAVTGKSKDDEADQIEAPAAPPADHATAATADDPGADHATAANDTSSGRAKAADAS